jgi:hypothetical protein
MMGRPTNDQLARYCELKDAKAKADRESRSYESELHTLHEAIVEHMTAMQTKACKIHGFNLMLVPGQVRPKWKDEFVAAVGAAAATLVEAKTEPGEQLKVIAPAGE